MGKWLSGSGSFLLLVMCAAMVWLLIRRWVSGIAPAHAPFSLALPPLSLLTVAVFAKMTVGALSGFEGASIFAGECWAPERNLARSVWIAAPLIAVVYIVCTGSFLAYITPEKADLVAPTAQLMQVGFAGSATGLVLARVTIGILTLVSVAQMVATVGMVSRLPMVVGWDGLLPPWWSELHPRFGTPVKALAAVAFAIAALGAASLLGAGEQEAVQVTQAGATGSFCVVYLLLFGMMTFGLRRHPARPPSWLRLAAWAGVISVAVALLFQVVPLVDVVDRWDFALKVGGVLVGANLFGAALYGLGVRRLARALANQAAGPR